MIDLDKINPVGTDEPLPEAIQNFLKNNPDKKHESLYLCESVDMDGNVIDTKIGVNLLTNYGLKDHFADGNQRESGMYIYLGSGQTAPDPASSSLTSYISQLGRGTGHTQYYTYNPIEYDSNSQTLSTQMKLVREYWDYTSGSNAEYEIWEIGVGHDQSALRTHALIYDEHGQQTCIVKRPNTRLYITVWWTSSVSIAQIPDLYNEGKYCFVSPLMAMPYYGYRTIYWSMTARGVQRTRSNVFWTSGSTYTSFSWYTHSYTNVVSGDAREVHYEKGPTSSNEKLWEDDIYYLDGWYISASNEWENRRQRELHTETHFAMTFFDQLPEPEELETYWIYTNTSFQRLWNSDATYTGNEMDTWGLYRIDDNFGSAHIDWRGGDPSNQSSYPATSWSWPIGNLPCSQFNISELKLYNHITKEWDIPVPFKNEPDKQLNDQYWRYFCYDFYTKYNNVAKHLYVFVNMFPHDSNGVPIPHITGFSNSNMVIAATDEYWDTSTYVEIANLSSVPSELQQKKYYVVVAGTNAVLNPLMSRSDWHMHELVPAKSPYELTHNTTGVLPRIRYHQADCGFYESGFWDAWEYGLGSKPLVHNGKGFFFVSYLLCFKNQDDTYTTYDLLLEDKYVGDKYRRYMTRNGDKIVVFGCRNTTDLSNSSTWTNVTKSYAYAANRFDIWTITDANTAPTRESLEFVWSDSSVVNNSTCYHLYSWSDLGYLVATKRRTGTEFIWVDIYAQGGAQMHLVTNAKHARVMANTSVVVYQDINLTMNNDYVFQIYDMSNDTFKTLTINDGTTYTVQGIYGYNDHVYIRMLSSENVNYTYYYNRDTEALEKLDWYYDFMGSDQLYLKWADVFYDDYCIMFYGNNSSTGSEMFKGNKHWPTIDHSRAYESVWKYKLYPCINEICGGKHLLLTTFGLFSRSNPVFDLGLLLDSSPQQITDVPYEYYSPPEEASNDMAYVLIPFDDGIIRVCTSCRASSSSYYRSLSGRMFWFPPEMCMRMYIKGTTYQLNSFNAPVRWSLTKTLQWNITNDLSRLLPENNNGG